VCVCVCVCVSTQYSTVQHSAPLARTRTGVMMGMTWRRSVDSLGPVPQTGSTRSHELTLMGVSPTGCGHFHCEYTTKKKYTSFDGSALGYLERRRARHRQDRDRDRDRQQKKGSNMQVCKEICRVQGKQNGSDEDTESLC